MTDLWGVDLPYACYGLVVRDGLIINAPPISRWMVGKKLTYVLEWVWSKGGSIELIEEALDDPPKRTYIDA